MNKQTGRIKDSRENRFAGTNINRTDYLRLAQITTVRVDGDYAGTVDIKFLDSPEYRKYLLLTQQNSETYNVPTVGDIVIIGFGMNEEPYILGYIPAGIKDYLRENPDTGGRAIRAVKPGDRYWRGPNGQELYLDSNGNVILDDGRGGSIKLSASDGTVTVNNVNLSIKTEAGLLQFGIARRKYIDPLTKEIVEVPYTIDGNPISTIGDSVATEFHLKVVPYADNDVTTEANIDKPLAEIRLGFSLSDLGLPNSPWQMELKVNDNMGQQKSAVKLSNTGMINIEGTVINIGSAGINWNNSAVLSAPLINILTNLIAAFNSHTHLVVSNIADMPEKKVTDDLDAIKSTKVLVD